MSVPSPSDADVQAVLHQLEAGPGIVISLVDELEPSILKR